MCDDIKVTFVDHKSNLTLKNGDVDASAFHVDDVHLSASVVDRVLSNYVPPHADIKEITARESLAFSDPCRRKRCRGSSCAAGLNNGNGTRVLAVRRSVSTKTINHSRDNGTCGGQRTETLRKNLRATIHNAMTMSGE